MTPARNHSRPYYEDLYRSVFGFESQYDGLDSVMDIIPEDVSATLAYVIDNHPNLTDREREIAKLRYIDEIALRTIADRYDVAGERIRQATSIICRKLRVNGLYRLVLRYGVGLYQEAKAEYDRIREARKAALVAELAKSDIDPLAGLPLATKERIALSHLNDTPITYCMFSVRTTNCLMHGNIDTIGKLAETEFLKLWRIRNLGRKCLKEILLWLDSKNIDAEVFCDPDAQLLLAEAKSEMEVTTPCQGKEI